jgi:hypothetical protein
MISPQFILMPKLGFTYFSTTVDNNYFGSESDSNFNLSYGLDMKYLFSDMLSGYVGFTVYNPEFEGYSFDANHFSIGVESKF